MRSLYLPLAIGALAAVASAQNLSTIQPFLANNGGGAGWTTYYDFDVTNGFVLLGLEVNCNNAPGTEGSVDVYIGNGITTHVGNEGVAGAWTLAASGLPTTSAPIDTPTAICLDTPVVFNPGQMAAVALHFTGNLAPAYTNGTGTNQSVMNAELTITTGSSSTADPNTAGTIFTPRVGNATFYYNGFAKAESVGAGCGADGLAGAVYEEFDGATSLFDFMPGTGVAYIFAGNAYTVIPGFTPIDPAPGTNPLTFLDDDTQSIPLPFAIPTKNGSVNEVFMCSNGFMSLEPTANADFSQSTQEFLDGENRIGALWVDMNPTTGGTIETHTGASGDFHITFTAVPEFANAATTNTFQISISPSGTIEVKYDVCMSVAGLVGYTDGGGVMDPGASDMNAATLSVTTSAAGDLGLSNDARPVSNTTVNMNVDNIPPGAFAGALLVGFSGFPAPGVDLSIIGMPGCFLTTAGGISVPFAVANPVASIPLPIGNLTAPVFTQAAVINPGVNALGVVTSNGVNLTPSFQ